MTSLFEGSTVVLCYILAQQQRISPKKRRRRSTFCYAAHLLCKKSGKTTCWGGRKKGGVLLAPSLLCVVRQLFKCNNNTLEREGAMCVFVPASYIMILTPLKNGLLTYCCACAVKKKVFALFFFLDLTFFLFWSRILFYRTRWTTFNVSLLFNWLVCSNNFFFWKAEKGQNTFFSAIYHTRTVVVKEIPGGQPFYSSPLILFCQFVGSPSQNIYIHTGRKFNWNCNFL